MRSACASATEAVVLLAAGEDGGCARERNHVSTCLRCQAEVAAYRRMFRALRALADDPSMVPAPEDAVAGGSWARRAACVGGLTAASAAGVLVWYGRRRGVLANAS